MEPASTHSAEEGCGAARARLLKGGGSAAIATCARAQRLPSSGRVCRRLPRGFPQRRPSGGGGGGGGGGDTLARGRRPQLPAAWADIAVNVPTTIYRSQSGGRSQILFASCRGVSPRNAGSLPLVARRLRAFRLGSDAIVLDEQENFSPIRARQQIISCERSSSRTSMPDGEEIAEISASTV